MPTQHTSQGAATELSVAAPVPWTGTDLRAEKQVSLPALVLAAVAKGKRGHEKTEAEREVKIGICRIFRA